MCNSWVVDADSILSISDFEKHILVDTPKINSFLAKESNVRAVLATKGFGKTFLLTAKRISLQGDGYKLLPDKGLRDVFVSATNSISHRVLSFIRDKDVWCTLWKTGLCISILKSINKFPETSNEFGLRISPHDIRRPSEILDVALDFISKDRKNWIILLDFLTDTLPLYKNINSQIALFIDRVDERFSRHIDKFTKKKDYIQVWFNSQIALLETIYELQRLNHHIKIFAGLRSEILLKLPKVSSLTLQLKDLFMELNYDETHLKSMFVNSIELTDEKHLIYPEVKHKNPLRSFLGQTEIYNQYVDITEDIFEYITRHTLRRPRDFMYIGEHICNTNKDIRQSRIGDLINELTKSIAESYLTFEVAPFYDINFTKLLPLIKKNIYTHSELESITKAYAVEAKKATEPFLILYKCGLLGIEKTKNLSAMKPVQHFLYPGEHIKEELDTLPYSNYYYIHPILNEFIDGFKSGYVPYKFLVGYNHDTYEVVRHENLAQAHEDIRQTNHPKTHSSGLNRCEITDAAASFVGREIILDFGCGEAPMLACLAALDEELTRRITYIGIDKSTEGAEEISVTRCYKDRFLKEPSFYKYPQHFDELNFTNVTHFYLTDSFHELNIKTLHHVLGTFINSMSLHSKITLIETRKTVKPIHLNKIFFHDLFFPYKDWLDCVPTMHNSGTNNEYLKVTLTRIGKKRKLTKHFIGHAKDTYSKLYETIKEKQSHLNTFQNEYIIHDEMLKHISEIINS